MKAKLNKIGRITGIVLITVFVLLEVYIHYSWITGNELVIKGRSQILLTSPLAEY